MFGVEKPSWTWTASCQSPPSHTTWMQPVVEDELLTSQDTTASVLRLGEERVTRPGTMAPGEWWASPNRSSAVPMASSVGLMPQEQNYNDRWGLQAGSVQDHWALKVFKCINTNQWVKFKIMGFQKLQRTLSASETGHVSPDRLRSTFAGLGCLAPSAPTHLPQRHGRPCFFRWSLDLFVVPIVKPWFCCDDLMLWAKHFVGVWKVVKTKPWLVTQRQAMLLERDLKRSLWERPSVEPRAPKGGVVIEKNAAGGLNLDCCGEWDRRVRRKGAF